MNVTARCPACNTTRVGAFRYCRTCGYDFEGPRESLWGHPIVTLPGPSAPVAPAARTQPTDGNASPPAAPAVAVADRATGRRNTPKGAAAGLHAIRGLVDSLDATSRRSLIRVAAEVGVLVVLVVVAGAMSPRSGTAPPSGPSPGGTPGATLGITADDAVRTFGLARLGSYTFTAANEGERLVGEPEDGSATIVLFGDPADLRAVALTVETDAAQKLDSRQRRRVADWLAVYAAGQVEYLLASIDTALDTPEDTTVRVGTAEAEVRLDTRHESDGTTRVRLILAPPTVPSPP